MTARTQNQNPLAIVAADPPKTRPADKYAQARSLEGKIRRINERLRKQVELADRAKVDLLEAATPQVRLMVETALRDSESEAAADIDPDVEDLGDESEEPSP
jgi:hypothetical protein